MSTTNQFTYDFSSLTEPQRRVLGYIAINMDAGHNQKTLQALEAKGLIVSHEESSSAWLGGPPMTVKRWDVPLPVHMAWCLWCSEHYEDEVLE